MCKSLKNACYEGHSLCFAVWFFSNTYSHSVYSSFSKKPPSACTHLTILSSQLPMTPDHVEWGMSKMRPSKNARTSLAFWNCFPFSSLLTEGNKNQSQGTKSGEYGGWVTSWTSLGARKSRVTAAVWALALSLWSSKPRTPVWGRHLHHVWTILGKQWLTYQSAVTVFLSSSGMVAWSWIDCCSKDVNVRIKKVWSALNKFNTIWKSELSDGLKIGFFRATIEMVLLYGSTARTLTGSRLKVERGMKMLGMVKNVTWRQRITNEVLYVGLPRISTTVRERRLWFSYYCRRIKNEVVSDLFL